MKKAMSFLAGLVFLLSAFAQTKPKVNIISGRPKLVVGIVVDQMRWDFLYRYYDRYGTGGFKRLIQDGYSCENTFIPYTPTVTAAGHTCIYTGSIPAIHGITGNDFYDYSLHKALYCSEDKSVQSVGCDNENGQMSPRNMLVTTIGDELKLATNFRSKVIGIALKDRGAILPAGHSADAAYWYDNQTGRFISSTYYMNTLPKWVDDFNAEGRVLAYYRKNWNTLYPIDTYVQSDADSNSYESRPFGKEQAHFPYVLNGYAEQKNYGIIRSTPYGNSLTVDFAEAAITHEALGKHEFSDMLTISFSSTDYIGHAFGPNAVETEDAYLRLDKDIASLLSFLDLHVGAGNYTVFLSADHGVAHVPGFLDKHHIPNGNVVGTDVLKALNEKLKSIYGYERLCLYGSNYQFYLDHELILEKGLDKQKIIVSAIEFLEQQKGIDRALDYAQLQEAMLPKALKEQLVNGYYPKRCGDILVLLKPGYIDDEYGGHGTTHGVWSPYDAHIPLLFYGKGIRNGSTNEKVYMTDIAPTLAALLHIQMPSGCIGQVIKGVIK